MNCPYAGELAALATAGCWTATGLAFEAAGKRIGSLTVNLVRLGLAVLFLSLYCLITRGNPLPTDASAHAWIWLSASGLIGLAFGDLCLFRAFILIGSRLSLLLMSLVPLFTAFVSFAILGETLSATDGAGMALTVGGVVWVILERKKDESGQTVEVSRRGVLLGICGALGQAVGLVLSKLGMGSYDAFAATLIRVIAGFIGFAIIISAIGWWPKVRDALGKRKAMLHTGIGAVFGPFLGVSFSLVAVKYTQAGVAATIMALVPVLIIAPSALLFKEPVTPRAVLGALIAVAGTSLLFL